MLFDQTLLQSLRHGFGFGMHLEFFVNAANVKRNRVKGNIKGGGGGFLGMTLDDQF